MNEKTKEYAIVKFGEHGFAHVTDTIVNEEALEIEINGTSRFLCMRLPGNDQEQHYRCIKPDWYQANKFRLRPPGLVSMPLFPNRGTVMKLLFQFAILF